MTTLAMLCGIEKYAVGNADMTGPCTDVIRVAQYLLQNGIEGQNIFAFMAPSDRRGAEDLSSLLAKIDWLKAQRVRLMTSGRHADIDDCWRKTLVDGRPLGSRLFVYWSGHGLTSRTDGSRVFLCSDYEESLPTRVFPADVFLAHLHREPFARQVHIFDVCGNYPDLPIQFAAEPAASRDAVNQTAFFATVEGQYAMNGPEGGEFTSSVLESLERNDLWSDAFAEALVEKLKQIGRRPYRVDYQSPALDGSLMPGGELAGEEVPTGGLSADDPSYVPREIELRVLRMVRQGGVTILVRAPRQFGKSSLLNRMAAEALRLNRIVIQIETPIVFHSGTLRSPERFYQAWGNAVADALGVRNSSVQTDPGEFTAWMEREVLGRSPSPVTLIIEEADRLLEPDFRQDVFAMFKTWNGLRANRLAWKKLDLYIAMSQRWELTMDDSMRGMVFGATFGLPQFGRQQFLKLLGLYGALFTEGELVNLMELLGGHPYLSRVVIAARLATTVGSDSFIESIPRDTGPCSDHLRGISRWLFKAEHKELRSKYRDVVRGFGCEDPSVTDLLAAEGLARIDETGKVVAGCGLYERYFAERL